MSAEPVKGNKRPHFWKRNLSGVLLILEVMAV